ncbi:hypothetical protein B9Z55_011098 [Caenorhabditis nigoni]|uniref:Sdz-33 F-box domain-containing protein n=1 Tax=Caenorhabditis nigoni TaxID=1611254 RepID=A0A2G5UIL8_9PELO|nr:hypothetical protein B9Z55_011098 [Caenorhabditis nigoni]
MKAHSLVKSLRVPIICCEIEMRESTEIRLLTHGFGGIYITLRSSEKDEEPTSLNDLPASVEVSRRDSENEYVMWSNQGLSFERWIQHISSAFKHEDPFFIRFHIGETKLVVPSFRNVFPKIKYLWIYGKEPNEKDILYSENILKVFLPVVGKARLFSVPLCDNFSLQHIGMTNLEELILESDHNVKFDDLLTMNVERLKLEKTKNISLRDLNRFFKLWMKGSFPRLKYFSIRKNAKTIPDWDVLMKGLKGKEVGEGRYKRFLIKNCRGVCAHIVLQHISNRMCHVSFFVRD